MANVELTAHVLTCNTDKKTAEQWNCLMKADSFLFGLQEIFAEQMINGLDKQMVNSTCVS